MGGGEFLILRTDTLQTDHGRGTFCEQTQTRNLKKVVVICKQNLPCSLFFMNAYGVHYTTKAQILSSISVIPLPNACATVIIF
uniref:Uncharacterized protein n=1 Tax=Pyxicephalus adspersus TaxID=30357 RepID=A0AAV3AQX4_PYXAD|nr:TPA: hypothetical protein GDO54_001452 [Pyxicephalus adspersus]